MVLPRWLRSFSLLKSSLRSSQRQQQHHICMLFGGIILGFSLSLMFSLTVVLHWYYYYATPDNSNRDIRSLNYNSCLQKRSNLVKNVIQSKTFDDEIACDLLDIEERLRNKVAQVQTDMRTQVSGRIALLREITEHKQQLTNMQRHVAQYEFRLRALWLSARVAERQRQQFLLNGGLNSSSISDQFSETELQLFGADPSASHRSTKCLIHSAAARHTGRSVWHNCTTCYKAVNRCDTFPYKMSFAVKASNGCGNRNRLDALLSQLRAHPDYHNEKDQSLPSCITIIIACTKDDVLIQALLEVESGQTFVVIVSKADSFNDNVENDDLYSTIIADRFSTAANQINLPPAQLLLLPPPPIDAAVNTNSSSSSLPLLTPIRRKYILSYNSCNNNNNKNLDDIDDAARHWFLSLTKLAAENPENSLHISNKCSATIVERQKILASSTFVLVPLILPSSSQQQQQKPIIIPPSTLERLMDALRFGAVPILIVDDDTNDNFKQFLPLSNVIDWSRAALIVSWSQFLLPVRQLTHRLNFSLHDEEIFRMRLQGRRLYDTYWSTMPRYVESMLGSLRYKLKFYPSAVAEHQADNRTAYRDEGGNNIGNFTQLQFTWDEVVGPIEAPYASPKFQFNYSSAIVNAYHAWNDWFQPLYLYPYTPYDASVPWAAESKFEKSAAAAVVNHFRPLGADYAENSIIIGGGEGGAAGAEMARDLGGDAPYEQYTIVMLTYKRETVLLESLWRLHQLPYLNKVIVVWNDVISPPPSDFAWPKLHVPLVVILAEKNTLNNRFMPYDEIETEAVLSIDDDIYMRPDELTFAFRVWRENRDRLVGFPARYQTRSNLDGSWRYNSNYTCEYAMILTGVAFVHKYYLYRYAYDMPPGVRELVDSWMNCEDIAMNFLVAHENGHRPAVKVTSRWTFKCPSCGSESLWHDAEHFRERSKCINLFTQMYGYNPLRVSQFRADSVLYKTRTPVGKEKCFKFV